MDTPLAETFRFNEFRIDTRTFAVSLNGAAVSLEPRVYDLVIHLIRRRDRVVTKDELLETVWMQEQLSESVIARAVCIARKAFSDPKCIQTVYRRGYRWMTPVTIEKNELLACTASWPDETSRLLPQKSMPVASSMAAARSATMIAGELDRDLSTA